MFVCVCMCNFKNTWLLEIFFKSLPIDFHIIGLFKLIHCSTTVAHFSYDTYIREG